MHLRDALPETMETERLRLRAPVANDLEALVTGANNWKVVEPTASLPFPYLEEHGRGFIERASHKAEKRSYVIALQDSDRLIGIEGLSFRENVPVELGYWLAENHWGRGYAQEAVTALIAAAGAVGIGAIRARVLAANLASARVLQKTGFSLIERTTSVIERHRDKPLLILEWRA